MSPLVQMVNITKTFPGVVANDKVSFEAREGEIHALLGENGAGKTTLMNVLYGLYQPDEGDIYIRGEKRIFRSPHDAIRSGLGMVHQHFMLVSPFTVTENMVLGLRSSQEPFLDDRRQVERKIMDLSKRYGLKVDPRARIWQLSVGEQQRVEILKALYRGADLLILDEPTSVLTPQEVQEFLSIVRSLAEQGKSIIFITHKLDEVMAVADQVTVLRDGKVVGAVETKRTDKKELARMMVGREVFLDITKNPIRKGAPILKVEKVWALNDKKLPALKGVSLTLHEGEILGIAGVDGNGQSELEGVITGLRRVTLGRIIIANKDVTNCPPHEIMEQGVAHIPADRQKTGLIMDFSVAENMILEDFDKPPFARRGWLLDYRAIEQNARNLIADCDVRCPGPDAPAGQLSGGNAQRVILARELSRSPRLMVAAQPTRGLDVGATEYVRRRLLEQRDNGIAVLLISTELEEILSLSDRVAVMYEGEIVGMLDTEKADVEEIGLMMAGTRKVSQVA